MRTNKQTMLIADKGCSFSKRCDFAQEICFNEEPVLEPIDGKKEHWCSCFFKGQTRVK